MIYKNQNARIKVGQCCAHRGARDAASDAKRDDAAPRRLRRDDALDEASAGLGARPGGSEEEVREIGLCVKHNFDLTIITS